MKLYAFELGREKALCLAELQAMFGTKRQKLLTKDIAVFEADLQSPIDIQNQLGGSIKTIEIIDSVSYQKPDFPSTQMKKIIEEDLLNTFSEHEGKVPFSISIYDANRRHYPYIKDLLTFSKKILKSLKINSRFVNQNFKNPKSSTLFKAKVLDKGVEFCVILDQHEALIGKTVAIQNIDNYSKRDYNKPARDAKVGMLPPKLSQIMINLAGPETKAIFDPFCGLGGILMEAQLMNKKAYGSDIDPEMTAASEANCQWTQETFHTVPVEKIFTKDARFLSKGDVPGSIDAIVTETYLGPALLSPPPVDVSEKIFRELANLHFNWLAKAKEILPKGKKIVMCVAAHRTKSSTRHLDDFEKICKELNLAILNKFTYSRETQFVARDIYVLENR